MKIKEPFKIRQDAFPIFFYFLEERMNMFWRKQNGDSHFTDDPILSQHRFTNVYRAIDRTSQYLIKNVIYNPATKHLDGEDVLLRILVFKIFNKIETWEFLEQNHGEISIKTFDVGILSKLLDGLELQNQKIFNPAYIISPGSIITNPLNKKKHDLWLSIVDNKLIREKRFTRIAKAQTLKEVFDILRECTLIGDFYAYQYAIDFNYSEVIDFDENSFVKAGVGAKRGVKKCFFADIRGFRYDDAIRFTWRTLEHYQKKYGYTNFKDLYGRRPTLIDIQNCFCETGKYLRKRPDISDVQVGDAKIKQRYKTSRPPQPLFLPPKWGLIY